MDANRSSSLSRRIKGLICSAAIAGIALGATQAGPASAAKHVAADGAGAAAINNIQQFAVNSPAMVRAQLIGVQYWGMSPCSGSVTIVWAPLDASINASSTWWNPTSTYGNAAANGQCTITFNQNQAFDWPKFCTIMVHELGHLSGQQHSPDPNSVMYAYYQGPISQCQATPAGVAPTVSQSAAPHAAAASVGHRASSHRKAHSRYRKAHRRYRTATHKHVARKRG